MHVKRVRFDGLSTKVKVCSAGMRAECQVNRSKRNLLEPAAADGKIGMLSRDVEGWRCGLVTG